VSRGFDELPSDPELAHAASSARAEWRREEEEYLRAAEEHWAHQRTLLDIVRELMHRGDTIAVAIGSTILTGRVVTVGDDWFELAGPGGSADLSLDAPDLVVRVLERAPDGGRRGDAGSRTFRARLLEREMAGGSVVVGYRDGEVRGALVVGRDQVCVGSPPLATYVPIRAITMLRPAFD
jgi:hypothetical protein